MLLERQIFDTTSVGPDIKEFQSVITKVYQFFYSAVCQTEASVY